MDTTKTLTIRQANWSEDQPLIREVREAVFVREQQVDPVIEWDSEEPSAQHFLILRNNKPLATGRITSAGKIGRMAVLKTERGNGIGLQLLNCICEYAHQQGLSKVYLHAQTQALPFYQKAGFTAEGDEFIEANIPHLKMTKRF